MNFKSGELNTFCQTIISGQTFTGNFVADRERIETTLYSFDRPIELQSDDTLTLKSARLSTISLFQLFPSPAKRLSFQDRIPEAVHSNNIQANLALEGPEAWLLTEPVRSLSFAIPGASTIFENKEKFQLLKNPETASCSRELFKIHTGNLSVVVAYSAKYDRLTGLLSNFKPHFTVDFDRPVDLMDYRRIINCIVAFCSLNLGVHLSAQNVRISKLSLADIEAANKDGTFQTSFQVFQLQSAESVRDEVTQRIISPFNCHNKHEIELLSAALTKWISRSDNWYGTYALAMGAFGMQRTSGEQRLLNACKWLEEIPTAKAQKSIDKTHINEIAKAACLKAEELGLSHMEHRIPNALSRIREESRSTRFSRLITHAWGRIGLPQGIDPTLSHLKKAYKFRNPAAHGYLDTSPSGFSKELLDATEAMEALCFLLSLRELHEDDAVNNRVQLHPIVKAYRSVLFSE